MPPVSACDDPLAPEAILGIDAAWTDTQPSGVALIENSNGLWRAAAVAPSYESFMELCGGTDVDWDARYKGSTPNPSALIEAVDRLLPGVRLSVVAVDMPMATVPICGRREADNEVSRKFGKYKCAVHSPNQLRPGPTGAALVDGFTRRGFRLSAASALFDPRERHLIEVYPHPALVALTGASERLKYKLSKAGKFWPELTPDQRRGRVISELNKIEARLRREFDGIELPGVHAASPTWAIKAREDAFDSLVCAWVGIQYREGRADDYGDETAAIWIPPL